jgi:hypothetical protein
MARQGAESTSALKRGRTMLDAVQRMSVATALHGNAHGQAFLQSILYARGAKTNSVCGLPL